MIANNTFGGWGSETRMAQDRPKASGRNDRLILGLVVVLALEVVVGVFAPRLWPGGKGGAAPPIPDRPSPVWLGFDDRGFTDRHAARFERVSMRGSISLGYEPTKEIFRASHMEVLATDRELTAALGAMRADLLALATSAGAAVTAGPSNAVGERPIEVLRFHFREVDVAALRGFYFTYRVGPWTGAVDVFATPRLVDGKPGWAIVCIVHEPEPAKTGATADRRE